MWRITVDVSLSSSIYYIFKVLTLHNMLNAAIQWTNVQLVTSKLLLSANVAW